MTVPPAPDPSVRIQSKGHYAYGFTILPNVLRDRLMPQAGTDACTLAYLILSWAAEGTRGARLSARYIKGLTRWSPKRLKDAKAALLAAWPDVFDHLPGDAPTSRPETWFVDFDQLSLRHATYLQEVRAEQAQRRGPGRPKKPVATPATGISSPENPVATPNTGFSQFLAAGAETLFRHAPQGCGDTRHRPVSRVATLKDIEKTEQKRGEGESALSVSLDSSSEVAARTSTAAAHDTPGPGPAGVVPPVGGAAHAASGEADPVQEQPSFPTRPPEHVHGLEEVPGGAAAVAELRPVPRAELAARPLAGQRSPAFDLLVSYGGDLLRKAIQEKTRTGNLPRADGWLRLTLGEIHHAGRTAEREAERTMSNVQTLFYRALDRLIGAGPQEGGAGTVMDPGLREGAPCTVKGQPGVVLKVSSTRYTIRLAHDEDVYVDRTAQTQLATLQAVAGPAVVAPVEAAGDLQPGAIWRDRTGHLVRIERWTPTLVYLDGLAPVPMAKFATEYTCQRPAQAS
ncbi:hypothetical protein GO986_12060 [Deinococcus sp. HMF7620]|uniref:Uncharacterized protein n=1 Tax=Deinococcus arboris TaxID=2682977 RepID=A0A7C9M995_9DEIO|nr:MULTISPECIES: hypothetical protein [Deinococcus]MBZ9752149.1 hypothetical protein [Deinococcus betulae]MVN87499.1 hypothetical protein [Deinococcus arboris]